MALSSNLSKRASRSRGRAIPRSVPGISYGLGHAESKNSAGVRVFGRADRRLLRRRLTHGAAYLGPGAWRGAIKRRSKATSAIHQSR